jgi:hypothetical protein
MCAQELFSAREAQDVCTPLLTCCAALLPSCCAFHNFTHANCGRKQEDSRKQYSTHTHILADRERRVTVTGGHVRFCVCACKWCVCVRARVCVCVLSWRSPRGHLERRQTPFKWSLSSTNVSWAALAIVLVVTPAPTTKSGVCLFVCVPCVLDGGRSGGCSDGKTHTPPAPPPRACLRCCCCGRRGWCRWLGVSSL